MNRGRSTISILLIISLLLTGFVRDRVTMQRQKLVPPPANVARLKNLNSFSLALLLGGLRGPLVMYLWPSVENQKNQKDLEDIDTKIEMIRLLQPEFDSVHIFQMWNKAYNLSVQMSSVYNKYLMVLDALDYGHRIDAERPDDINIQVAIAGLYFDKLGESAEKRLYNNWLRRDTLPHQGAERSGSDPNFRRSRHDQMLDASGHILPEFKQELQYLKPYDEDGGFPYGLSPHALGYNYYKRAQVLHNAPYNQEHLQLSGNVMDTRPPVCLKVWAEELWGRGRLRELEALGYQSNLNADRLDLELIDATASPDRKVVNPEALKEAFFCYDRATRLAGDAIVEYDRRFSTGYSFNLDNYAIHKATLHALTSMVQADSHYLKAISSVTADRTGQLKAARDSYQTTMNEWYTIIFKYWVEDRVVLETYPRGPLNKQFNKATIQNADPRVFPALYENVLRHTIGRKYPDGHPAEDLHVTERDEYKLYIDRAAQRMNEINKALAGGVDSAR